MANFNKEYIKYTNILYVEDESEVRRLTAGILTSFVKNITCASNGEEGLELFKKYNTKIDSNSFDLVITDINMPKMSGLEMLAKIREIDKSILTIVTTAHDDAAFLKQSINLKVKGYVTKPLDMSNLIENISEIIESKFLKKELETANKNLQKEVDLKTQELQHMINNLEKINSQLDYQATHDSLTSLSNRLRFNEELDKELERDKRYSHGVSLFMLDIDDFKKVNDTYGHSVGDDVLVELANIMKRCTRQTDLTARWGGEEFIVLLPETLKDDAFKVANHIRIEFEKYNFEQIDHSITVSIGVSQYTNNSKEELINNADKALYQAKNSGKNKVVIY